MLDRPVVRLPERFADRFAARGWSPHRHQLDMLATDRAGDWALLIAPTGGGKILAGFLPSLVELSPVPATGLHTIHISPLKALAVDIHRNLEQPIAEMELSVICETRTGDTPPAKRQRRQPPNILLTTPESLALLLSYPEAPVMFAGVSRVVIDELHALPGLSVRGRYVSGRCFVSDGRRLILPAFGAYAGGLDARDPAIAGLFPGEFAVFVIGRAKLHRIVFPKGAAKLTDF